MTETEPPPTQVDLQSVYRLLRDVQAEMEHYRHALLDSGGAFDKLRSDLSDQIRGVNDHLTDAFMRLGAIEKPPVPEPEATDYRVLVVDDEPTLVSTFSRILAAYGFECVGASNGRDAIAKIEASDFDVVLCDLYMPGNGSTLCKHVVEKHPEISVVLMTGADERMAMQRAIELNAVHCLMKPCPNEHVVLALRAAARIARASRRGLDGHARTG